MKYLFRLFWMPYLGVLHWNRSRLIVEVEDAQQDLWFVCEREPDFIDETKAAKRLECLCEQLADMENRICHFWDNH